MFVKMRLTDFCCCFNDIGNSFLTQLKYVYTSMLINGVELYNPGNVAYMSPSLCTTVGM